MSQKKVLLKIVIVGDSGVGKTSILNRFVRNVFNIQYKATIGADFLTKEIEIDDETITLQIWDTAGQERFQSLGKAFYRGADAFIIVYDVNIVKTFENMDNWLMELNEHYNGDIDPFPLLILGNKMDEEMKNDDPTKRGIEWPWIKKRGGNTIFYQASCKEDNYKPIIDQAFIDLSQLCINNRRQSVVETKNVIQDTNMNSYNAIKKDRIPRETDPAKKKMNPNDRVCGGRSNNAFCLNPIAQNPTHDTFCKIL